MKRGIWLLAVVALLTGCKAVKRDMITTAMHDIWEEGNLDRIDANYEPELAYEIRQFVEDNRALYPDLELTIDRIVIEGNTYVTQWTVQGTHRDLGQPVTLSGVSIRERVEGKIVSEQMFYDTKSIYDQLGFTMIAPDAATPFDAVAERGDAHKPIPDAVDDPLPVPPNEDDAEDEDGDETDDDDEAGDDDETGDEDEPSDDEGEDAEEGD